MSILNREELLKKAKDEDELSNLKQHADKMIRGFENFNDFSSNRAIWELVQNACDLSLECEVVVDYAGDGISFSHNGKPFDTKSLISLIKQVSGKYGGSEDMPEVGKYGTGFLTTHTFGRKFRVNSFLKAGGSYFKISEFLIDRSPRDWQSLSRKIGGQIDQAFRIIKEGQIVSPPDQIQTTFSYIPDTTQERDYIAKSALDLDHYVPLVLTINDRLKEFTFKDNSGVSTSFRRLSKKQVSNENGIPLWKTVIDKNGGPIEVYSLWDEEQELEIILPINSALETFEFPERVARLFLYYPLIGSENFGLNFIINSHNFLPTEPRDGIHLKSNKDQVQDQENQNRKIITKASELIFKFLKSNVLSVSNPLLYARINFVRESDNILLNEYFIELQNKWTSEFKTLPILETNNGPKLVSEGHFFDVELIEKKEDFDTIYEIASKFHPNLPVKDKAYLWSSYAVEWKDDSLKLIQHEDIVSFISEVSLQEFNSETLIKYYNILIREEKKGLFSDYSLLPNIDGNFRELMSLVSPKNIDSRLIELGRTLIPETIARLIHPSFSFDFQFEVFNRKEYSNRVKEGLEEMALSEKYCYPSTFNQEDYSELQDSANSQVDHDYYAALISFFKLNNNLSSISKPVELIKIISRYYGLSDELIYLSNVGNQEEELDVRTSRKIFVQSFFNLLSKHSSSWVERNIDLLLSIAYCNEYSLKEAYSVAEIYPSQVNKLKSAIDLKKDVDLTEEIICLYNDVQKTEVRSDVVYRQFNEFVEEDRLLTNKYLTTIIEETFFTTDIYNINEHPFKDQILSIIKRLRDPYYAELFPRLDDKKANLMLDVVTNEKTKDDIFSIVTLKEDQLKKLGKLVQEENFEAILKKAEMVLLQEKQEEADFQHKYKIGTYIEGLIREALSDHLQNRVTIENSQELSTSNVQGGQDIIISLDGKPFYYIEVKSRWKSDNSVMMSKLQLQRSVEENHHYALCAVDVSRYSGSKDRYQLPIEEIIPLTRFVKKIGENVKPLIESNLYAEKNSGDSIYLVDYRGVIPQAIIQHGEGSTDFNSFIQFLTNELNKN